MIRTFLLSLALSCCSAPIQRAPVERPALPACEGYTLEPLAQGDAFDLYVGDGSRFVVIEFKAGELIEDESPWITGGAPRVSTSPDTICPTGALEGDACLEARWASGVCWRVE